MLPGGAFRALLLLVSGVSAEIVLPPTNLTVSCNNVNVTASWQASRQQPNTRFRVHFRGEENQETTDHRFDLSQFVWRSEERYMEVHSVSVTAILGGNQSETVESETFTFNEFKTSHIKCKLVFPPVDLKVNDSIGTVTFRNPLHFYRELQQVVRKFEFDVTTRDGKMVTGTCLGDQKNCQHEITYPEDVNQCVTLRGRLYDRKGIRYVEFNETCPICPETTSDIHVILLIVLLLVTFTVVSVIIVFICLTKSWTFKKDEPNLPNVLKPHTDIRKHCFTRNDYIQKYNAVILIKNKPSETPSVSYEDDDDNLQGSNDGSDVHYQYGCYRDGRCLENRNQELECSRSDDDSADDSVKTEERSPYDSPHILLLDKVSKKE
ncbi:interferon gamma receptor 1 isoform 2 precursor [Labrus bergylta]|uniref:Interferon gamma receptor 1 n=1 Tax=Labrus bergylta TaxID=56723 RepID=A0A3Q3E4D2_9LABR|nr:interferon gamma receptor 1 isoform 2 precursor [Labrus bergylta]